MMKTNQTIQTVKKTIRKNNLIQKGDRVLVALSGGADSVFLLVVLKELSSDLGFTLSACHVEHGIRGKSSLSDMNFSQNFCDSLGIELYKKSFNVPEIAKKEKVSVEAAGRAVRYGYFKEIMDKYQFTKLATAHHSNDKVETVLMNILRGCGLRGFAGIEYLNDSVIRPLLDVKKTEIIEFLESFNIQYCVDETNSDICYTRNKIRLKLIPDLKEFNPSFDESILRQSEILTAEDEYMDYVTAEAYEKCVTVNGININVFNLLHTAIQRRVMFKFIAEHKGTPNNISFGDVEAAIKLCRNNQTGKTYNIAGNITVGSDYGLFYVHETGEVNYKYKLEFETPVEVPELGIKVTLKNHGGNMLINDGDAVFLRNKCEGDYFYPVGMKGRKKLKDFFVDKKIPRSKRNMIPILEINGEIASVVGCRDDNRFAGNSGKCALFTEKI